MGQLAFTCGVNDKVANSEAFSRFVRESIGRHANGDWGDLCDEDKQANEAAVKNGSRLFSAYEHQGLPKIWVITEGDRSATTVLFPDEY